MQLHLSTWKEIEEYLLRSRGIIIPIVEDATVRPAEKFSGYPLFFISGMRIEPIDAVSDVEEPEMPPNSMLEATLTKPNPPRKRPTIIKQ